MSRWGLIPVLALAMLSVPACGEDEDCHSAYEPCLPNLPGDALDCSDLDASMKPVTVKEPGNDPYWLDADRNGKGCELPLSEFLDQLDSSDG